MKEHMLNYGITTNITGTDGNVTPLLFTDFRHVADTSGMYRIFRILAFGMEQSTTTLNPAAATIRPISIGFSPNQVPVQQYNTPSVPTGTDQIAALSMKIMNIPSGTREKKWFKWPFRFNEIQYNQLSAGTPIGYLQSFISGADASTQYTDGCLYFNVLWFNKIA